MELTYERSEIPKSLIDECNKLSEETGETQFIFDNDMSTKISNHYTSKNDKREYTIDLLLASDNYHIGSETHFKELPSRFAYYDSEIRLTGRYDRYKYVVDFLTNLTFIPSQTNLGPEFEQSYTLDLYEDDNHYKFIVRVKPNLFIDIISHGSIIDISKYSGYFNKSIILKILQENCPNGYKTILRDRKLESLLE